MHSSAEHVVSKIILVITFHIIIFSVVPLENDKILIKSFFSGIVFNSFWINGQKIKLEKLSKKFCSFRF